jgi:hypothetical protein
MTANCFWSGGREPTSWVKCLNVCQGNSVISMSRVIRFTCCVLSNCAQFAMHDAQDTASYTVNTRYKLSVLFCNSVFVIKQKKTAHSRCANH